MISSRTGRVMATRVVLLAIVAASLTTLVSALVNQDNKDSTTRAPWNATWTDTLKRTLLSGYDKFSRPSHHLVSTNVTLGLSITHIELDDAAGMMTVHGWIKMAWNDEKLKWNSSDYGGLRNLHVADHEIWQPDIVQYNSASGSQVDQYGNTHCIVSEQGNVLWVPPTKLTTFCDMDLTKWPSDEHVCTYTFGSWTYDGVQINLDTSEAVEADGTISTSSVMDYYKESGEWTLLKVSHARHEKTYPCCEDAVYISIDYGVTVRRKGGQGARGLLVKAPAAVSALLSLLSHCLPPRSPMAPRIPLAVAPPSILALSLLYFSSRLPIASNIPDIVMLYTIILYMSCISSVVSIVVLNMAMARRNLPWAIRRALCSQSARCLRLPKLADTSTTEELQSTVGNAGGGGGVEDGAQMLSSTPTPARDWMVLATAIDRIFFIVLLLVFIIAGIVYGC